MDQFKKEFPALNFEMSHATKVKLLDGKIIDAVSVENGKFNCYIFLIFMKKDKKII